jgi:TRAP-type uncharacterized transport system fused permease subunit
VSFITPPVVLADYAAASLAGANPLKTAFMAVRLGFVSLLVPFFFLYNPSLVGHGSFLEIVGAMFLSITGRFLISSGFEGYTFYLRIISVPVRAIFMASGVLLFFPYSMGRIAGAVLMLTGIGIHLLMRRRLTSTA